MTEPFQHVESGESRRPLEGTWICVEEVAGLYEHSGHDPDEITELYPDLTLADIQRALVFYYVHVDEFRPAETASA